MTYSEKLRDPRWQRKRLEIMQRDGWACKKCQNTRTTLNVHHLKYQKGKAPWEYPNDNFVTLCEDCHQNEHSPTSFKIYLAGKIEHTCWRHKIVKGLRNHEGELLIPNAIFDKHHYTGPFFIACDHGCGHSKEKDYKTDECGHGMSKNACTEGGDLPFGIGRDAAFGNCLVGIEQCDFIFAWIENCTCYGTLVEIGFALARGKHIFIGCPSKFPDDLWFSSNCATTFAFENSASPTDALNKAIAHMMAIKSEAK